MHQDGVATLMPTSSKCPSPSTRRHPVGQVIPPSPARLTTTADQRLLGVRDFIVDTAQHYPNLHVQMNTFVTKVLIDHKGYGGRPRAYGVAYEVGKAIYQADPRWKGQRGKPGYAYAIREVIVSGGAFETPKLLKLSGIGPAEELQRFNIPVIINNPHVGANMQDRYEYAVVGKANTEFPLVAPCTFGYSQPDPCMQRYLSGNSPVSNDPAWTRWCD